MTTRRLPFAAVCAWLLGSLGACTTPNPNYRPGSDAADCVAETDAAFCARIGATCEDVTRDDNCGKPRTAMCGTCSGTDACVVNVCKPPVCSTFSFPNRTPAGNLNDSQAEDAVTGVSGDGNTVLWQRSATCNSFDLLIGDATAGVFTITNLSAQHALAPMAIRQERSLTLTADGLTIIGVSTSHTQFLQSTRAAVGDKVFGPASDGDFAALTVTHPAELQFPAISSDGLAFYFRITGDPDANKNGLYETVRASKTIPFPAAVKMPGAVQSYESISATSSDRMALFVQNYSFEMAVLTRRSVKDSFVNPNALGPPPKPPGSRTRPLADCQKLIGTFSMNACVGEDVTIYSK